MLEFKPRYTPEEMSARAEEALNNDPTVYNQ